MNPLLVISSAAVVLQFVEYGINVCGLIEAFHKDDFEGFYEGLLANITRYLRKFASYFNTKFQVGISSKTSPNHETQLEKLIERCYDESTLLWTMFYKIATDNEIKDNNVSLYLRIRKIKEIWKQPDIELSLAKLKDVQKQLGRSALTCVSTGLNAVNSEHDAAPNSGHSKIKTLSAVVERLQQEDIETSVNGNTKSSRLFDTALAIVIVFQNGAVQHLPRDGILTHYPPDKQQILMTIKHIDPVQTTSTIVDFEGVQNLVLDRLFFCSIYDRLKAVEDAHQETYEWIFCAPEANKPWPPFVDWLKHGSGCYYISGKPGSGKSTLMNFVSRHKRTQLALQDWADGDPVRASFFFWNLGSPLQRSSIGLLRGLLYDILTKQRSLISVVMPDLWHDATTGAGLEELSLERLKRWFRKLLAKETTSLKFFIVIDGIDEFEGDHDDLVKLIKDVVKNKNVKVLLSSRPNPLPEDSFKDYPTLRLQDLTRGDIRKYIDFHLAERLKRMPGSQWAVLVDEITDRSCGIFLWIVLVVRSLQEGDIKGDTIKEMRQRLVDLPSDLKRLYDHMIKSLSETDQRQASEMFQLLLKAKQVHSSAGYPLEIQLSFCNDDPGQVTALPMGPLEANTYRYKCEQLRKRILSRGLGLIESREWETNRINGIDGTVVSSRCVDFIHRTVVEFLCLPEIWTQLISLSAAEMKYDPSAELFRSCVFMCKTLPPVRGIDTEISTLWHMMDRALVYASMAEDSGEPVVPDHLRQLDAILTRHWKGTMKCFSRKGNCDIRCHWANGYTIDPHREHILSPSNFVSIALFHGLTDYIENELAIPAQAAVMNKSQLLYDSLRYIGAPPWKIQTAGFDGNLTSESALFQERQVLLRPRWVKIAVRLLEAPDTDPNEAIIGGTSAWSIMVSYITAVLETQLAKQTFQGDLEPEGFAFHFTKLLDRFIIKGADLDLCPVVGATPAWKLVEQLFSEEGSSSRSLDPWAPRPMAPVNTQVMIMRAHFKDRLAGNRRSQP